MQMSKYDAGKDVYYDVPIDRMGKEMKSFGLADEEIAPKLVKAQEKVARQVAKLLGVKAKDLTMTVEDDKITIVALRVAEDKVVEEVVEEPQ